MLFKDTLIFSGDYVDGWVNPQILLDFIIDLKPNKTAFAFVAITTIYWNGLMKVRQSVVVQTRRRSDGFGLNPLV
jgi:hypothetical protein